MYALLAEEKKEKDDFDQSECNFYISFLTSDDTNTIPPSFKDQVSYFPILSRAPRITSVHLHVFMIMVISCNTRDKMYSFLLCNPNRGIPVTIISIISTPCEVDYTGPVVRLVAV